MGLFLENGILIKQNFKIENRKIMALINLLVCQMFHWIHTFYLHPTIKLTTWFCNVCLSIGYFLVMILMYNTICSVSSYRKLKTELHELRKKAAVNPEDENSNKNGCARCHEEFGLFSSGSQCPKCKHHVCPKCQIFTPTGKRWLCTVCHKAM